MSISKLPKWKIPVWQLKGSVVVECASMNWFCSVYHFVINWKSLETSFYQLLCRIKLLYQYIQMENQCCKCYNLFSLLQEVIMHEILIPAANLHLRIKDLYAVGPLRLVFCFTAGQFQNPCQVRNQKLWSIIWRVDQYAMLT